MPAVSVVEILFDFLYLVTVISIGLIMVFKSKNQDQFQLFGIMTIVLGVGDTFHLLPRIYGLITNTIESHEMLIGLGKLITSVTMTIFYILLYRVWQLRYNKNNEILNVLVYFVATVRIFICLFPQNEWFNSTPPVSWGIYRNIPFVILGVITFISFYKTTSKGKDKEYRFMPLAIILSFVFYIPVVLFSNVFPPITMLMIPKTISYLAIVFMGYISMNNAINKSI